MKITVFGATGMVGKRIVGHALAKGFHVTAFGRNTDQLIDRDQRDDNLTAVKGYVFDEDDVAAAIRGADGVLSVLGGGIDGSDKTRSLGIKNIIKQMEKTGVKRIVALGGMGVLNANENQYLLDTPGYPSQYKAVGQEHLLAFLYLQASSLEWSFVCAPDILDADATGRYVTSKDYPPQPNHYQVTAGDLAEFMINELNTQQYIYHRAGISRS